MADIHYIQWFLSRTSPDLLVDDEQPVVIVAAIRCEADEDAMCRQNGPWVTELGTEIAVGECWAGAWIERFGAERLWNGSEDTEVNEDCIEVEWDGGDWLWHYIGEDPMPRDDEVRLDQIETGLMDVHATADDATAALDAVERTLDAMRNDQ